jgi:2-methylcitrate dehydratase PrpD
MTNTSAILDFAAAPHELPPAVRTDALRLLGDTLAVMAAGAASDEALRVRSALSPQSVRPELVEGPSFSSSTAQRKNGPSTATHREPGQAGYGTDGAFDAAIAAFHAGFAIHCLEWDAVHEGAVVHALSVVTAALLASSHRAGGSDPEQFLTALTIGVDIASGLGIAATGPMRFFRPATAGVIGAALAVARLEGMSRAPMADVLGLAYSFLGGTMQAHVEASIALPLQIGRAAQAAVQAVDMVRVGLTGPHDVLEGPFGYSALIEPLDLTRYTPTLGQVWRISEVSIKPFPSGRASHGALGALQQILPGTGRWREATEGAGRIGPEVRTDNPLRQPFGLPPTRAGEDLLASIAAIDLYAPPLIARLVGRPWQPGMTPAYARLCLAFLAPLMLRDGVIDPRAFTPGTFADPAIARLAAQVRVHDDTNSDGNAMTPQRLVVTMADGSRIERHIPATLGSLDAPMDAATAASKYALSRDLAGTCDPRIVDDPLGYATDPR